MITMNKTGGRTVQLLIPFEFGGKKYDAVVLSPLTLGHVLEWNIGRWRTTIDLLVDLAGVEESVIRELRYPDADRVMETFLTMLPPEIRADIQEGRIPVKRVIEDAKLADELVAPVATNGRGEPIAGPGVPLPPAPEPGFDLSDEAP